MDQQRDDDDSDDDDSLLDRLRGTGVGVEDPNIVGDAGPTDVAPGRDPVDPAEPVDSVEPPDLLRE